MVTSYAAATHGPPSGGAATPAVRVATTAAAFGRRGRGVLSRLPVHGVVEVDGLQGFVPKLSVESCSKLPLTTLNALLTNKEHELIKIIEIPIYCYNVTSSYIIKRTISSN